MKEKKLIITSSIILGVLVLVLGTSFAIFTFSKTSTNSKLIVGDIYMHYNETNELAIENAMPNGTYDENTYFEFTIDGKNTTVDKDIWYEIVLNLGDNVSGKTTRIKDNFLAFTLKKQKDDSTWETVIDKQTFNEINNTRLWVETIPATTTDEIKHTYRLYMWIADNINICGGDLASNCDYTLDNWKDVFASIKVGSNGDFTEKEISFLKDNILKVQSLRPNAFLTDTDGTIYLSGKNTKDQVASSETAETVDFNYVWYSGKLWRIVAINPDGTMKIVTNDHITAISYGPDVNFYDISKKDDPTYTGSYIYQWLNEDFLDTLYNYKNIIVEDSTWNVTQSSSIDSIEKTNLINKSVIGKNTPVGLLNNYEYYMGYKSQKTGYYANYLYDGYYFWLLNPYSPSTVWEIISFGYTERGNGAESNGCLGVRPSVNLKANIQIESGDGTIENPYKLVGDQEKITTNITLLNTRISGEYVNFDGELYRIVNSENGITKLNKNDYIKNGQLIASKIVSASTVYGNGTTDDYWDYYLNNTWYNNLTSKDMLVKGTYYINTLSAYGVSYKNSLCRVSNTNETTKNCVKTTNIWNSGYVGLPRYGEMFASQQGNGYKTSYYVAFLTHVDSALYFSVVGKNGLVTDASKVSARPSIYIKSNAVITSGDGTKNNPFEIALKS